MKEKLQHFMMGRYGIDSFSKFLLGVTVFFCAIDLFFHSVVLNSWTLLLLIYTYYRVFSKNHSKRYQENMRFLQIKNKLLARFQREKSHMQQRKTHHIYTCPTCKEKDVSALPVQNVRQNSHGQVKNQHRYTTL